MVADSLMIGTMAHTNICFVVIVSSLLDILASAAGLCLGKLPAYQPGRW